jgi:glutamyl endopeptidase
MRLPHFSGKRRSVLALVGGLFAVLMTLVFVAPADSTIIRNNRVQTGTTSFPYNSIVEITTPEKDIYGKPLGFCTGWLYAPNMIATAGHCVYDKKAVTNGYFDTTVMRVWPGISGSTTNAKSCGVVKSYVPTSWTSGQSEYYDYGALKLDCPLATPLFKYGLQPIIGDITRVCGYPRDKPIHTQWCSDDAVREIETLQVFYANDTCKRVSGAPVMVWKNSEWNVTAIHTTGTHATPDYYNHFYYNHGTRITSTVSADLSTWKNDTSAGTPPKPLAQPPALPVSTCD